MKQEVLVYPGYSETAWKELQDGYVMMCLPSHIELNKLALMMGHALYRGE